MRSLKMVQAASAVLLTCAVAAPGATEEAGKADPAQWSNTVPNGVAITPVARTTDAFPLSDQANRASWQRYEPMSDEFGGEALDAEKWLPRNPGWKGRQPGLFTEQNVAVKDGKLQLTMRAEEPPAALKAEGFHTFTCAAVQSKGTVRYGYFEVKAKAMRSGGSSAFWFYKNDPDRWTEIDVFEIGGGAPGFERKLFMTMHVFHTPAEKKHWQIGSHWLSPTDLAADYHVYGLEWDEQEIKFFFDGVLVRRGPNTHWHQPLTMNFDSETMPEWFGLPKVEDLPSTYSVEYVRAWQRKK